MDLEELDEEELAGLKKIFEKRAKVAKRRRRAGQKANLTLVLASAGIWPRAKVVVDRRAPEEASCLIPIFDPSRVKAFPLRIIAPYEGGKLPGHAFSYYRCNTQ
jgi:hypothetical protein